MLCQDFKVECTMNHEFFVCLSSIQRIEGYDRLIVKWWWGGLAIIAMMVLLACWRLTVQIVLLCQKPRSRPNSLFKELIRLHRLSAKEKSLISGLVARLPAGVPAAILFVDPSCWARKQEGDPVIAELEEKLYAKIFGFPRDRLRT